MREAIEPFAAAKAAQLISRLQLKSLQQSLDVISDLGEVAADDSLNDQQTRAFDDADLEFHLAILQAGENSRMLKIVSDYHVLTEIIGVPRHAYSADVIAMTVEDHSAILNGLRQRDSSAARDAMLTHIRNSRQLTLVGLEVSHRYD